MSWINFCRLNEAIEELSPTAAIVQMKRSWDSFEDKEKVVSLFTDEYPINHLGTKSAIKWLSTFYEVFDNEINTYCDIYGDLGDGIYFFDESGEDSNLSLNQVYTLLTMDCSKIGGQSYRSFYYSFEQMSALEKKWFIRYWTRKTRHGFGKGNVVKLLAAIYNKKQKEVKQHIMFNTYTNTVSAYEANEEPSMELTIGNYIAPMLAKAVPKSKWPRNKLIEYKYDGARYQIHREDNTVIIFNRKGVVVTQQFPDIVEKVTSWEISPFIVDTEIYPVKSDGQPALFQTMNARFHSKDPTEGVRKCPVSLAIFDCLLYKSNGLINTPLSDRLQFIEKFPNQAVREVRPSNSIPFYSKAISKGYEGIMVKNLDSCYEPGKRSVNWAKYKPPRIELDVVITSARYGEGRRSNVYGSFDISVNDNDGGFINIGAIGTGFSDSDLSILTQQLRLLVLRTEGDVHNFSPRIVLQVTSDTITMNEQGEYGLRFPRMMRIRDDKSVSDINTIDDIKGMM